MISSTNLKERMQKLFTPVAEAFDAVGITPDILTAMGFFLSLISALFIYKGVFSIAGFVYLFAGSCDMLDGILARVKGRETLAGAFFDSFIDRYADFFPLAAFVLYGYGIGDFYLVLFSLLSIVGSFATSYAKARAESLFVECKVGLLERPERFILLIIALFTGYIFEVTVILAVLSNFTALQRFFYVWKRLKFIERNKRIEKIVGSEVTFKD